jgi:hypothetical protein
MAAIYLAGVVTTVPYYDIQAPHLVANVLNWHTTVTGLTQAQLTSIQGVFNTAWEGMWATLAANSAFYKGAKVIDMSSQTGLEADNVTFTPVPGAQPLGPVADSTCLLLSFHGLLRYRGGHARIYLPGMSTNASNNDGRTWTPAALTGIQSGWDTVVAQMAGISIGQGGPLKPVIWHKKKASLPNQVEDIVGRTAQSVYANQRRRVRKVSRHKTKTTP